MSKIQHDNLFKSALETKGIKTSKQADSQTLLKFKSALETKGIKTSYSHLSPLCSFKSALETKGIKTLISEIIFKTP